MATQVPFHSDGVNTQSMPEVNIGAQTIDSNASHLKFTLVDGQEWSIGPDGSLTMPDTYTTGTPKLRVTVDTVTLGVTGQPDQPSQIDFTAQVRVSPRIVFIDNQNYDYPTPGATVNGGGFTNATIVDFDQNNYQFIVVDQDPSVPTQVGDSITIDDGSTPFTVLVPTRDIAAPNFMFFTDGNKAITWSITSSLTVDGYAAQDTYVSQNPCSWDDGTGTFFGFTYLSDPSQYSTWPTDGTAMTISGLIMTEKLNKSVVIGTNAATNTSSYASGIVAIGHKAGQNAVQDSIVIGHQAGGIPGSTVISIGERASSASDHYGVAIGGRAGLNATGSIIAIGDDSGYTANYGCIDIGTNTGASGQNQYAIAVGFNAGRINQGLSSIAIGRTAGNIGLGANSIAIGNSAAPNNMGNTSIAIGHFAGRANPQNTSGSATFGNRAIAIGAFTMSYGNFATGVGDSAVAGDEGFAGGSFAISSGNGSVSIGANSSSSGNSTVAIGHSALAYHENSIAIGYRAEAGDHNIVLNATGSQLGTDPSTTNAFHVKPVRDVTGLTGFYRLVYNPITGEIGYSTTP